MCYGVGKMRRGVNSVMSGMVRFAKVSRDSTRLFFTLERLAIGIGGLGNDGRGGGDTQCVFFHLSFML